MQDRTADQRQLDVEDSPPADPPPPDKSAHDFPVVGIGASAGGLESLERLFSRLPADTGMAFVVIQHLSPDFKSLMDELLRRRTSMRVVHAEHEASVEPNTVHLLPPMKEMIIRQRRLLLNDKDPRHGLALPIDLFLRSLAHDIGDRAIAVILSGSGSDGSRGIQEIHRAGGVVLAESPETAQFNGMPMSAIRTGVVEHVLAPEDIADALAALARPRHGGVSATPAAVAEQGMDAILRLLRDEYAIDFSHYKASTVTRRIERRLALNRAIDLEMYIDQLKNDPRELNSLYHDLLIGVTRFFRDTVAFETLEHRIIPEIVERATPEEQIRVWVPGCATGQEPYSIAMLLHEQLSLRRKPVNIKILATDVHKASLEVASAGIYTEDQVVDIGHDRLARFFTLTANGYQISKTLRESIVFAPHNLIRDAPFTKLDLITCRNLLIYFQPHAQKTVLSLFHFALKTGGFLFLGSSESPGGLVDEFETIDEHAKVYRKRRDIGLPRDLRLPLPRGHIVSAPVAPPGSRAAGFTPQLLGVYDRLLDRFMPPGFLVELDGQLVDTFAGAEAFLKVKPRRPSQHILDLLTDDVGAVVSGAMHRIRRDNAAVHYANLVIPDQEGSFTLSAEPVENAHGAVSHVLFTLRGAGQTAAPATGAASDKSPIDVDAHRSAVHLEGMTSGQMHALRDELSYTKENLQAAVEELETTNEELQATNEELIASNEELQSTNEELHSVNEELYTVNAEYQKKNVELQELNDDVEHLFTMTDVSTLFLDRQLCIRKFTTGLAAVFDVLPQDVGRPLRTFAHSLRHPHLMTDIERVLREGITIEQPTWDAHGSCYFLRILPYRARKSAGSEPIPGAAAGGDLAPDGVVLTLTDISALEQARSKLAQLSAIVESSEDAIVGTSLDGTITTWNDGATRLYGYTAEEAIGRPVNFLHPVQSAEEIAAILEKVREGRGVGLEAARVRQDGTEVHMSVKFSPIFDAANRVVGVSAISRDITQLTRARREVAEREERIRLLLDSTAEAIYGIDLSGVCTFCNMACARLLGYPSPASLIGRQMQALIHRARPDGTPYPPEQWPIYDVMRRRQEAHVVDEVLWRADGTSFDAEYWGHPIRQNGDVIGAVVTFLDITERKRAEREIQEGVQRREQFLAMLSHELRNPLAAILSATRLIGSQPLNVVACGEAGQVVERQAHHMARLLDDLLDVSRITQGRITLQKETIDVRETSRAAIEAVQPLMASRGTQLVLDIADHPVIVSGDRARLQQVQANLLSNATKYSPPGATVHLSVRQDGDHAVIRVADTGYGIEPEMLPRIFELFVQGEQSIARSDGGLGIGLTLLRMLVDLHDGRVEALSDGAGKGSTFTVWLPLAAAAGAGDSATSQAKKTSIRTVVLVEDQPDARRMMQLVLESAGLVVSAAGDGAAGAELIERTRPDLALVDLGLPVMSGFELARRVRKNPAVARTRLVALSGYGQESDVQAALEAGFDEHVTKPPTPERLEQLLAVAASPHVD